MKCSIMLYDLKKKLLDVKKFVEDSEEINSADPDLLLDIREAIFDLSNMEDLFIWLEDEQMIKEVD